MLPDTQKKLLQPADEEESSPALLRRAASYHVNVIAQNLHMRNIFNQNDESMGPPMAELKDLEEAKLKRQLH